MASNGVPVPGVCGSYERLLAPVGLSGDSMFQSVSAEPGAALWVAFFCGELGPEAFVGLPCTGRHVTTANGGFTGTHSRFSGVGSQSVCYRHLVS